MTQIWFTIAMPYLRKKWIMQTSRSVWRDTRLKAFFWSTLQTKKSLSSQWSFPHHNSQHVNCLALWLNQNYGCKPLVFLNKWIKTAVVMSIWIISHVPWWTIMMWENFMQQYSKTLELCACNYMYGTTGNTLIWPQAVLQVQRILQQSLWHNDICASRIRIIVT